MNTTLIKVERNTFKDAKGNEVKYCKIYCLSPGESNENKVGCDVKSYTTKYEYYDTLVSIYKLGKPVEINFEFIEIDDKGTCKKKPTKIGDLVL